MKKNLLKDHILDILNINETQIKKSFKITEDDINSIKEFFNKNHKDFSVVIDDLSESDLSVRGKMVVCCMIGYVNGTLQRQLFKNERKMNIDSNEIKKRIKNVEH